jgi:hypothetical protein
MPPSAQVSCAQAEAGDGKEIIGRRALRRLTNAELEATIRATFGFDTKTWTGLTVPPDPASPDGFTNDVDRLIVSSEYAQRSAESARKVASLVAADTNLPRLLPCSSAGGAACADTFITTFGAKLFRRPLLPAEKARYLALHDKIAPTSDFRSFVFWATATLLQSPNVLYRSEIGEPDGAGRFRLTPYEVASQLSFTFTGGPPDAELLQLAASNRLGTADQIEAAARGLIFDAAGGVKPAFREVVLRFADQWLGLATLSNLKKDDMAFPDFTSQIQDALGEETKRFISAVVFEQRGTLSTLLTAPYTFVDSRLAKFYNFGAAAGTDFVRVDRPAGWGVGLLAQGSMMAIESHSLTTSPTKRGVVVRARFMCDEVPPPPPVVDPLPDPTDGETTRQRYEVLHVAKESCKACHALIDPIGFTFEHLDASGRYRAKDNNFPIDDSGSIAKSSMGEIKVSGPSELAQALAKLPEVSECVGGFVAAYSFGLSRDSARCLARGATEKLGGGMSLVDFYVQLARSEHFRARLP